MDYLLVFYLGDRMYELELSPGRSATVGSGEGDSLRLDLGGLAPAHLRLAAAEAGVHILSSSPFAVGDDQARNRILSAGDVVKVTEGLSMCVFERRGGGDVTILLEGRDEITLGRSRENDIRMEGSQVSARHARLRREGGVWNIEDRGSRNGIFIDGRAVKAAALRERNALFVGGWKFFFRSGSLRVEYAAGRTELAMDLSSAPARAPKAEARYPFFQRSPRIKPDIPACEVEVFPPPNRGMKPSVSWASVLLPPVMMAAVMLGVSMFTGNRSVLFYTVPMSGVSVLVAVVNYRAQMKKWTETQRLAQEKYEEHLQERDAAITAAETKYLLALASVNPGAGERAAIASRGGRRLWERAPGDGDFLEVRLGTGRVRSNVNVKIPQEQLSIEEDRLLREARRLREEHAVLTGVPITHSFFAATVTGLVGDRAALWKTARTILTGVAAHHSYEDVKIVCVYPESEKREWEWTRWLPHVWDAKRERRFIACTPGDARSLLHEMAETLKIRRREAADSSMRAPRTEAPFYFLLLADKTLAEESGEFLLPESSALGMTAVYAYDDIGLLPGECQAIIDCGSSPCTLRANLSEADRVSFVPERLSPDLADAFARSLAPVRMRSAAQSASMPGSITFLQGYEVNRVEELDVLGRWAHSQPFRSIAAPIGIKENGEVFYFNIHEKGMGPHGIVAGATRWGKSETLTTWLLSVALNFPPHEVSFVLIDFKGDGLSGILLDLPHVAGVISDLNDITKIERNLRSLNGELTRRKRVIERTKLENIHKYQEAYRAGKVSEPMAYLIVVIDEFAELKTQFPDQMDGFISVARIGGSLGVYMVLATQSPRGIVAGQVSANSRFRICLKTSEAAESHEMLGTADAFRITTRGRGYVKVGNNEVYELVQTFYSKALYQPTSSVKGPPRKINIVAANGERILPNVYDKPKDEPGDDAGEGRAVAQYIKDAAVGRPVARPVWTQAMPEKIFLPALLAGRKAFEDGAWRERGGGLSVIVGMADDPENQTQFPLALNFTENGHHALYGAPSSGKTTFLQTALLSAALSYTPDQVQFLVLDFGSWGMKIFEQLPHTLLVADANDDENLKKAEEYLLSEIGYRKRRFAEQGVGTLDAYREITGEKMPAILIAVDNTVTLFDRVPNLMDTLIRLAREGAGLGLYLLLTASSTSGAMFRIAPYIKASFALQLTDRADYRPLVGGTGRQEPEALPGRGFAKGPLEFQTALCVDGASEGERVRQLRDICAGMSAAWKGARAALSAEPEEIDIASLSMDEEMVQIGIDRGTSAPFSFYFEKMNGCVISGPPGSGKTNALGLIARALASVRETKLYIYENGSALEALCAQRGAAARAAHDAASFGAMLSEIMEEYDRRDRRTDAHVSSPRFALCLDDFPALGRDISDESAGALERLIQYGGELGMYVYIAGDRDGLTKFHSFNVAVIKNCLESGSGIALGKNLKEHALFDSMHSEGDFPLGKWECCAMHGGKAHRVKLAKASVEVGDHA